MIIRIFNHNAIAWDQPMGMIQVDLKDFVAKKQPRKESTEDLLSSLSFSQITLGTSAKDPKVSGSIRFELINEETQALDKRTVTQKLDMSRGVGDEDFVSLNHRLTTDLLCMKIKQKFPQIKLKTEHLQIAVVSVMALMVFLGLGGGLIEIIVTMIYPAMMSILALYSESDKDDRVWLNYWIIFGIISAVDPFLSLIDFILPIISFQMIKMVVLIAMM
jgi:hypothetical protein